MGSWYAHRSTIRPVTQRRAAIKAARRAEGPDLSSVDLAAAAAFTAAGLSLVNVAISYRLQVGLIRRLRRGPGLPPPPPTPAPGGARPLPPAWLSPRCAGRRRRPWRGGATQSPQSP